MNDLGGCRMESSPLGGSGLRAIRADIERRIALAVTRLVEGGVIPRVDVPAVLLEVPHDRKHGDYASPIAMHLASQLKKPPRETARLIASEIVTAGSHIAGIEVAGPGFINFRLDHQWLYEELREIRRLKDDYGKCSVGAGKRIQIEFVSANPTGPMVVVQARAGAVGDTLARLLEGCGYSVEREFYVNDAGRQVELLGRSVEARLLEMAGESAEFPEDGYVGEYVREIARKAFEERGSEILRLSSGERVRYLSRFAVGEILEWQRKALHEYGVRFDMWFSENALHESGEVEQAVDSLIRMGLTYEQDGALWFCSSRFGDDKDRVIKRSNGELTYLAADIAYHLNKYRRGFSKVVDIWGPDHHGYIGRMKAAMEAFGIPSDALEILIVQLVRLVRGGETVRMSKRGGDFVTMEELLEEVGSDVARFFFLMRSVESHLDFDLDLAKLKSDENPVYYVQYAHARICSVFNKAEETMGGDAADGADLSLLREEAELELLRKLAEFPDEVVMAAESREPHRLTRYTIDLATLFHAFYARYRILEEDEGLAKARLAMADGVRIVLRNALSYMGVQAPEKM